MSSGLMTRKILPVLYQSMVIVPLAVLFASVALLAPSSSPLTVDEAFSISTGDGECAVCIRTVPVFGVSIAISAVESKAMSVLELNESAVLGVADSSFSDFVSHCS